MGFISYRAYVCFDILGGGACSNVSRLQPQPTLSWHVGAWGASTLRVTQGVRFITIFLIFSFPFLTLPCIHSPCQLWSQVEGGLQRSFAQYCMTRFQRNASSRCQVPQDLVKYAALHLDFSYNMMKFQRSIKLVWYAWILCTSASTDEYFTFFCPELVIQSAARSSKLSGWSWRCKYEMDCSSMVWCYWGSWKKLRCVLMFIKQYTRYNASRSLVL